jgi:hypothetical protein
VITEPTVIFGLGSTADHSGVANPYIRQVSSPNVSAWQGSKRSS